MLKKCVIFFIPVLFSFSSFSQTTEELIEIQKYHFWADFDLNRQTFKICLGKKYLETYFELMNRKYKSNTEFNVSYVENFSFNGIDIANKRFNIKAKARYLHYERLLFGKHITLADVKCDINFTITPSFVNRVFEFKVGNTDSDCNTSFYMNLASFILTPFLFNTVGLPTSPDFITNGVFGSLGMNFVVDKFAHKYIADKAEQESVSKDVSSIFKKIEEYNIGGMFRNLELNVDKYGLWFIINYDLSNQDAIIRDIISKLNALTMGLLNKIPTDVNKRIIQAATLECMGRTPTATEFDTYGRMLANGVSEKTVKEKICNLMEAQEIKFMNGFDLNKISTNHNTLIISYSGSGVWGPKSMSETYGRPIETITYGQQPTTRNYFGDAIYQKSYEFLKPNVVSVIGFPWLTYGGVIDKNSICPDGMIDCFDSKWWHPNTDIFAGKINAAIKKMAPGSKLIIMGKSMGGCLMEKVVRKLNDFGVKVDLLILIDPSCKLEDQSNLSVTITPNVKKVYNFRQTSLYPENDYQNGYKIAYQAPTIGNDLVVSAVGRKIPNLECEGTGHNDIDECDKLHARINSIVQNELGMNLMPIIKLLLD